ncbi:MAG: BON domain-containing protein, partial [Telluria sp.]
GADTACLIDNKGNATSLVSRADNAAERAADKTQDGASTAVAKTENTAERAGDKARDAGRTTATAASDTVITTKVKANLFKEPELKSMAINVETEKGVVMLSGFAESKAEADKAVKAAKEVDGVTSVKSTIKVK